MSIAEIFIYKIFHSFFCNLRTMMYFVQKGRISDHFVIAVDNLFISNSLNTVIFIKNSSAIIIESWFIPFLWIFSYRYVLL